MAIGYLVLTLAYYRNAFNGGDLKFMSTSLFDKDGETYNQSAILTADYAVDPVKLEELGLPRYTTTYTISQMCYNFSLGAAIVHVLLWHWKDLKRGKQSNFYECKLESLLLGTFLAFGGFRFFKKGHQDIDDPHYQGK